MEYCFTCRREMNGTPCGCRTQIDDDAMSTHAQRQRGIYSQCAYEDGMRLWRDLRDIAAIDKYLGAVRESAENASRRDLAQVAREGEL